MSLEPWFNDEDKHSHGLPSQNITGNKDTARPKTWQGTGYPHVCERLSTSPRMLSEQGSPSYILKDVERTIPNAWTLNLTYIFKFLFYGFYAH